MNCVDVVTTNRDISRRVLKINVDVVDLYISRLRQSTDEEEAKKVISDGTDPGQDMKKSRVRSVNLNLIRIIHGMYIVLPHVAI